MGTGDTLEAFIQASFPLGPQHAVRVFVERTEEQAELAKALLTTPADQPLRTNLELPQNLWGLRRLGGKLKFQVFYMAKLTCH